MDFISRCFNQNKPMTEPVVDAETSLLPSSEVPCEEDGRQLEVASGCNRSLMEQNEIIKELKKSVIDIDKIKKLIKDQNTDINSRDKNFNTVLHLAILKSTNENSDHLEFIEFLIKNGADIKARNKAKETPFLMAARKNMYNLIILLVEHPENEINASNCRGETALHTAVKENNLKVVKRLLRVSKKYDLKIDKKNDLGATPLQIAESNDNKVLPEIRDLLSKFSKQDGNVDNVVLQEFQDSESFFDLPLDSCHTAITVNVGDNATAFFGHNTIVKSPSESEIQANLPKENNSKNIEAMPSAHKPEEIECYSLTKKPRGICFVIKNEIFDEKSKLKNRYGCQADVENLKKTFEWMLFEFKTAENLSALSMYNHLQSVAKLDHSENDCIVVCILSHGVAGAIYGTDGEKLPIKVIQMLFCGDACKSLRGKPKMFFLNACREKQTECAKDGAEMTAPNPKTMPSPLLSDFFIGYSTPEGFPSWRYEGSDSWYITALCATLNEYAEREEFQHIMTQVNKKVALYKTKEGFMQIPSPVNHLRKKLWFFPVKM